METPANPKTDIGALVSDQHLKKVTSYIANAHKYGGTLLFGGNNVQVEGLEHGYYLQPTIIEVQDNQCKLNQEEIFGPVVTIMPFDTEEEVLQMANDVTYGLSATLWTNNLNRTMRMVKQIQAGIVWVNTWLLRDLRTPFGGVKNSGVGREGGFEALRFLPNPKIFVSNTKHQKMDLQLKNKTHWYVEVLRELGKPQPFCWLLKEQM